MTKLSGLLLTVILLAQSAAAGTINFAGTLSSNDSVFNRVISGAPPTALSNVGTTVFYDVYAFNVGTPGLFRLGITSGTFDTYLMLYRNSFVPTSPLANILAADDDAGSGLLSQLDHNLTSGVNYYAVVSSFGNGATGAYNLQISGNGLIEPGHIHTEPVPEPTTYVMIGGGLLMVMLATRAQQRIEQRLAEERR